MNSKTLMEMSEGKVMGHELMVHVDAQQDPWMAVKDVCKAINIANSRDAIKGIPASDLMSVVTTSGGQRRLVKFINEPGLYRLIFKSRKPEAERFQDWVCREVLPSIRRTGLYCGDAASLKDAMMRSADYMALRGIDGSTSGFGSSVMAICRKAGFEFERKPKRGHKFPVAALDMAVGKRVALRGPLAKADNERVFLFRAG